MSHEPDLLYDKECQIGDIRFCLRLFRDTDREQVQWYFTDRQGRILELDTYPYKLNYPLGADYVCLRCKHLLFYVIDMQRHIKPEEIGE